MSTMIHSFKSWRRLFRKLWRRQLLFWAGEPELLDTMEMQRCLIQELQNLNQVDAYGYKLTMFCDVQDQSMGYKITCVHGRAEVEGYTSKYFHSFIHNQTRLYFQDLEKRFGDFCKLYEADLLKQPGINYIDEEDNIERD